MKSQQIKVVASIVIVASVFVAAGVFLSHNIFAFNVASQVTVGTAAPSVTAVTVNNGTAITLTGNATTAVSVVATISSANGCSEITTGTSTILLYRNGVTSSTCLTTPNDLNCYKASAFTASSTCSAGSQSATTTFAVQYFAQATDASSSFSGQGWRATVIFRTPDNTTGTADSPTSTLNTTTAINVTTSSINYGAVQANTNTGATDQTATTTNVGNSSTTLQLFAQQTLTSGSNTITTSSQAYSTSSFTYPGTSTALTSAAVTVPGFSLTAPTTSTTQVAQVTYWGLSVPNATPTGTFAGVNVFQALYTP